MTETLLITNELNQLVLLEDFLGKVADEYNLNGRLLMNLKLAMEEAVTNIILYAYPGEKNKDISISLSYNDKELRIVITDSGIAFDPMNKPDPDLSLPPDERPIGGLGIYLVKQLMTDVTYHRSGDKNILTMVKHIH